jgi:uncharacterized membrane protein HdeD (DUF308 family)
METLASDVNRVTNAMVRGLFVRGIVAIVFGVLVLVYPDLSLSALVYIVAAFAAVDGITSLVTAFAPMPTNARILLILSGLAGLGLAIITVVNPQITELALLYLIGAWAIAIGVLQFGAAFSLPLDTGSKVLLFVYGFAAVAFGVIMFVRPGTGALGVLALISAFAIVTGVTLLAAGWKLRSSIDEVREAVETATTSQQPSTSTTAHA